MARVGKEMNELNKDTKNIYDRATTIAKQCGVDMATFDIEKVGDKVEELATTILNFLTINTLVTLLRAPTLRGDDAMQKAAKAALQQFVTNKKLVLPTKYIEEAQEIGICDPDLAAEIAALEDSEPPPKTHKNTT